MKQIKQFFLEGESSTLNKKILKLSSQISKSVFLKRNLRVLYLIFKGLWSPYLMPDVDFYRMKMNMVDAMTTYDLVFNARFEIPSG